ncbi:response regulator [Maritimibacter sp. DP1N21-5]|uniref:response regulator n=1 Tax=Maritimibacter sp. DP1N21-5 TaxID=2836867 RepID=UPI001C442931|nr:response regulator [Maritimibacter sp. DP1N21-5]MBV7408041.1 response regulator [Maritimibacter sp. DP1N21-5]
MTDELDALPPFRPTAQKPLAGLTVLVVDDSRVASEAIRLICLRSGARVRRADSLASAHRHLGVYRPAVVIVDMGLPDGSGGDLIRALDQATPRVPALIGMSGSLTAEAQARAAGSDGFLAKPVESVEVFQQVLLAALPSALRPSGLRLVQTDAVQPDPVALAEDLLNASDLLKDARISGAFGYPLHFLRGVAQSAHDRELETAVSGLDGAPPPAALARIERLLSHRLGATG